jgi:hypothetical protein
MATSSNLSSAAVSVVIPTYNRAAQPHAAVPSAGRPPARHQRDPGNSRSRRCPSLTRSRCPEYGWSPQHRLPAQRLTVVRPRRSHDRVFLEGRRSGQRTGQPSRRRVLGSRNRRCVRCERARDPGSTRVAATGLGRSRRRVDPHREAHEDGRVAAHELQLRHRRRELPSVQRDVVVGAGHRGPDPIVADEVGA